MQHVLLVLVWIMPNTTYYTYMCSCIRYTTVLVLCNTVKILFRLYHLKKNICVCYYYNKKDDVDVFANKFFMFTQVLSLATFYLLYGVINMMFFIKVKFHK